MTKPTLLPSWRPGATRDALVAFLDAAETLAVADRVAVFDNDGTLWCERPTFPQYDFIEDALRTAAQTDPTLRERPEYAAVLDGDQAAIGHLGLVTVGLALVELFEGLTPDEFTANAVEFMARARHRVLPLPLLKVVYQPMLELLDELRDRSFTIFIVSGGGTEFVRAISEDLYGVAPEAVVGTLIEYEFTRTADDRPRLVRTRRLQGNANEGEHKVTNIQTQLGRRPILGVGNSGGDREMLEWACAGPLPGLALLVDHDDKAREFEYVSIAQTFAEAEPITEVAHRLGWTVISMANDWETIFPS
jgi:phosphoserine phosphatase